jgi:hypothetical protein
MARHKDTPSAVFPAPIRKALDLRFGDTLLCGAAEEQQVLKLRHAAEKALWTHFSGMHGTLVKELIRERRREASREA